MSSAGLCRLTAGHLVLDLCPAIGGSIGGFSFGDGADSRPILRRCPDPLAKVLEASCFPLVPYVNRIRGGRFGFRGHEVRLTPNMPGDPSPLHGQGWLNPWRAESATDHRAELRFVHEAGEWPWRYEARQVFDLDPAGLAITLSCRNVSNEPMPCGLGFHPYFPCGPATRLDTKVTAAWTVDDQVLPVAKVPASGRFDLHHRLVCGQHLDNGFGGWGGEALMTDPDWPFELRLASAGARFFQLYSPVEGGIFVAEPVTHANAALNEPEERWAELGLQVLQPGEEMSLAARLEVVPR
jgi:aldose 1-epimerase